MATHRYIISAGHRNTDRGGAAREIDWTYGISQMLRDEIQRRGGRAWIIQEEDGDHDPSFSHGRGLQNVARLCVNLASAVGGADAYISMHYEGGPARGFFGIYPDARSGIDVGANNPMDRDLCRIIAKHVERTGMPKRTAGVVEPGVMSERQTGVGAQGYRLGEFVGTLGFRHTTARVILEAGNYVSPADRAMIWSKAWQARYVSAIVDGLEEKYGRFSGKPVEKPEPVTPFVKGIKAKTTDRLNVRQGYGLKYPVTHTLDVGDTVDVIADDVGDTTNFADGFEWVAVGGGWGTGWAAANWLEPMKAPDPLPVPTLDTFTTRYELPFRDKPGFNAPITDTLPENTKGEILKGPETVDGIGWYRVRLADKREGFLPASILRTLDIVGSDVAALDVD